MVLTWVDIWIFCFVSSWWLKNTELTCWISIWFFLHWMWIWFQLISLVLKDAKCLHNFRNGFRMVSLSMYRTEADVIVHQLILQIDWLIPQIKLTHDPYKHHFFFCYGVVLFWWNSYCLLLFFSFQHNSVHVKRPATPSTPNGMFHPFV